MKKRLVKMLRCLPIKWQLQIMHRLHSGKWINFRNPITFTEKLQWLKLNQINPFYEQLVDKIAVKSYVSDMIGNHYVIPTLCEFLSPSEITIDKLPKKFVMKTNHSGGGGGVIICRDKSLLNIENVRSTIERTMSCNWYNYGKEYPYKNIKPRIFCEQLLEVEGEQDIPDFKFYCFNGEPKYCQLIKNRSTEETIDFYDMKWNRQEFYGLNRIAKSSSIEEPIPENLVQMIQIARKLSQNIPFVRVDLYNVKGKIYFGELTFFPASGFGRFTPIKYNKIIGDLIKLNF